MGEITCSNGHMYYYRNIEGKDIKGNCKKCNLEIEIPYKSAHPLPRVGVKCPSCGAENKIPMTEEKSWLSYQKGSRGGTSVKAHKIAAKLRPKPCTSCGKILREF